MAAERSLAKTCLSNDPCFRDWKKEKGEREKEREIAWDKNISCSFFPLLACLFKSSETLRCVARPKENILAYLIGSDVRFLGEIKEAVCKETQFRQDFKCVRILICKEKKRKSRHEYNIKFAKTQIIKKITTADELLLFRGLRAYNLGTSVVRNLTELPFECPLSRPEHQFQPSRPNFWRKKGIIGWYAELLMAKNVSPLDLMS